MHAPTTVADIEHRFTNHPPSSPEAADRLDELTAGFIEIGKALVGLLPPSRETSMALSHLEQCSMWAKAAVARNQPDLAHAPGYGAVTDDSQEAE